MGGLLQAPLIAIPAHPSDDPRFLEVIQGALAAELRVQTVREVFLVRIDNWFDGKWLRFGSFPDNLSFPPFTPGRVLAQHHFVLSDGGQFRLAQDARLVHGLRRGRRANNLFRRIEDFSPTALFAWFGSNSQANGRGSLMIYQTVPEGQRAWYASFDSHRDWQASQTKGIAPAQLKTWLQGTRPDPA